MSMHNSITDIPGIRVGHAHNEDAITGCTVVLCEGGAVGGVDQRGGAPGTRETDALHTMHLVQQVHAIVLTGGSAFGLDAATGVVRYLEARGVGFDVTVARVPIVPAAVLFDLGIGRADVRPDAAMGYQACLNASTDPPAEGNVGAGMGATVGKAFGMGQAMKSGVGSASLEIGGGLRVAALAAVNAFGDVIDPHGGRIVAGLRGFEMGGAWLGQSSPEEPRPYFADTLWALRAMAGGPPQGAGRPNIPESDPGGNTVIGVVATNAKLDKENVNKVAQMAQDGLARSIRPAHTMLDGDTIFALSLGDVEANVSMVGAFAAEVFAEAVLRAVRAAQPLAGLPAVNAAHAGV